MRSVLLHTPPALLAERQRLGHDRRDEVWDGVLHMVPPPHGDHQKLNVTLCAFLCTHWEELGLGLVLPETGRGVARPVIA